MLKATKIHSVHSLNHQKIAKMEEEPLKTERICFGLLLKGSFHCSGGKNLRHLVTLPPQSGDKKTSSSYSQYQKGPRGLAEVSRFCANS